MLCFLGMRGAWCGRRGTSRRLVSRPSFESATELTSIRLPSQESPKVHFIFDVSIKVLSQIAVVSGIRNSCRDS